MQRRRNRGGAGIDHMTLDAVERYGATRLLDELISDLKDGRLSTAPSSSGLHSEGRWTRATVEVVDSSGA